MRTMDDYDDEVKYGRDEKLNVGLLFSFKSMSLIINRIVEETKEANEQYPKSELIKIWACAMMMCGVTMLCGYSYFFFVLCIFLFFYLLVVFQVFKAMKNFGYKRGGLIALTILIFIAEIGLKYLLHNVIIG